MITAATDQKRKHDDGTALSVSAAISQDTNVKRVENSKSPVSKLKSSVRKPPRLGILQKAEDGAWSQALANSHKQHSRSINDQGAVGIY